MNTSINFQLALLLLLLSLTASEIFEIPLSFHVSSSLNHARQVEPISAGNHASKALDYIVAILMENKNYNSIIGNLTAAPFINRLANDYGLASSYYDVSNNHSLPNYLGLTTGQTFNSWSSCNLPPQQCPGFVPIASPTIVDLIEGAGLSWKAYMESMPSNCYQGDSGLYVARHNPFVYFSHVINNPSECNLVVPAGNNASRLISDLSSTTTASNFMWLTPNLCDDMHNCSTSTGDKYLSLIVPNILNSTIFRTQRSALFLTWDEGWGSNTIHIPAIWAGPSVRTNFTSSSRQNHYSFLKTIETISHLPSLSSNDAQASAMTDFLRPPVISFTYAPNHPQAGQTLTFNATAIGSNLPLVYNWSFGDGQTSSGELSTHAYSTAGSYTVSLFVTDDFNNTASLSNTVKVDPASFVPSANSKPQSPAVSNGTSRPSLVEWLRGVTGLGVIIASAILTFTGGSLIMRARRKGGEKVESPIRGHVEPGASAIWLCRWFDIFSECHC